MATFFERSADFGAWLAKHHASDSELLVGYWKKGTGKPSVTWEETVDEALCWGWIDGIRKRIDDESYSVRFTPRRRDSIWSQRNLDRVEALLAEGRMHSPGIAAYEARRPEASGYTPATNEELSDAEVAAFGEHLEHWLQQPRGYRGRWVAWVHAAKRPATRQRRLEALVEASRQGIRIDPGRPFGHLPGT